MDYDAILKEDERSYLESEVYPSLRLDARDLGLLVSPWLQYANDPFRDAPICLLDLGSILSGRDRIEKMLREAPASLVAKLRDPVEEADCNLIVQSRELPIPFWGTRESTDPLRQWWYYRIPRRIPPRSTWSWELNRWLVQHDLWDFMSDEWLHTPRESVKRWLVLEGKFEPPEDPDD